jgi:two-component system CheB/CheR fusion protein
MPDVMGQAQPPRRRILVVEDNLDHAVSTVLLLRTMGHEVESALNGGAALATARTFRPDVVLLDLGLPDSSGWEVARRLKQEHRKLRIVAVTGRSSDEDRAQSMQAGCDAHLVKPVMPATLESAVGALPFGV